MEPINMDFFMLGFLVGGAWGILCCVAIGRLTKIVQKGAGS